MVSDLIREYPFLGSFFYGHLEDIGLSGQQYFVLLLCLLAPVALTCVGGFVGYMLQSVALVGIARQQGAGRRIRTLMFVPFARYFAIGKLAERCDVVYGADAKRRRWGRILLVICCVLIPIVTVMLAIFAVGLPGTQLFALTFESAGNFFGLMQIILIIIALPLVLLNLIAHELFAILFIALPVLALVCLAVGVVLLAVLRTLYGICYNKVLRLYFPRGTALALSVICAITGLFPIVLLVASRKQVIYHVA